MTIYKKFYNVFNAEHSLGKGEVHSSILCGSTTKPYKTSIFDNSPSGANDTSRQNEARNQPDEPWKIRGIRSADVLAFTLVLLSTLLLIIAAHTARHYAPPAHHECVKPTGIPATWFGDCGPPRFGDGR